MNITSERQAGTRTQVHEVAVDAPIESVWKAIADAEELTRWFAETATVEPGVGGTIAVSWDGPAKGGSRIETWEPNHKLRVSLKPSDMGMPGQEGRAPMITEYTIERRDGKT